MTETEALDIEATFLVANTPGYLYRHLRQSDAVSLLEEQTSEWLGHRFTELVENAERSAGDVAEAYAVLVALSLRTDDGLDILKALDVAGLSWGKQIRELALRNAPSITALQLAVAPALESTTQIDTSTTESSINMPPQIFLTDYQS
jgi:hypothetical protein